MARKTTGWTGSKQGLKSVDWSKLNIGEDDIIILQHSFLIFTISTSDRSNTYDPSWSLTDDD